MRNIIITGTLGQQGSMMNRGVRDYEIMLEDAATRIEDPLEQTCLISGGGAWSEHLAVSLFLQGNAKQLTLYLPSPLLSQSRFWEDKYDNSGKYMNFYHWKFSSQVFYEHPDKSGPLESITQLLKAQLKGSNIHVERKGLEARNAKICEAGADLLIIYGWSKSKPTDPHLLAIWNQHHNAERIHVDMNKLLKQRKHIIIG